MILSWKYNSKMPSLARLLCHESLRHLRVLLGHPERVEVHEMEFIEDFDEVSPAPRNRLAVLGRSASRALGEDRLLDVTLHELKALGVTAVVLPSPQHQLALTGTTRALAEQIDFAVLDCVETTSTAELLTRCASVLAGDGEHALRRVRDFLSATNPRHSPGNGPFSTAELLDAAGRALDVPVSLESSGSPGVPVRLGPAELGSIVIPAAHGVDALAARIVAEALAMRMEQALAEQRRLRSGTVQGKDSLLSELIVATEHHAVRLTQQARDLAIPIDGWHRAFMFDTSSGGAWSPDLLADLGESALDAVPDRERWLPTRSEGALILVESWPTDPRPTAEGRALAERMLARLDASFPALALRCGIGAVHETVTGLRVSVAEARVALGASHRGRTASYDQAGLRPIIVELAQANAARASVSELLGPIIALDRRKAAELVRTLQVYLDEHGSLSRASERLTLHRNSVAYRVRQAKELLGDELSDPDRRFALQLACRAYLLSEGKSE